MMYLLDTSVVADHIRGKRAIETFNPWMVDLISGVETIPGKKDFGKVEEFIRAVKG